MSAGFGWTLTFHLLGLVFWGGGLLAVTLVLKAAIRAEAAETRAAQGRLAQTLLNRMAHAGAAVMIVTGIIMVTIAPYYLQQGWLHAKLGLVLILIVIDLLLAARLRSFPEKPVSGMQIGIFHGVISALLLAIVALAVIQPH